jgi:hypothetical protein
MNFVKLANHIIPNLKNVPSVLLESDINTVYINSLTICNTSLNNIKFNLQIVITGSDMSSTTSFILQNLDIPAKTSLNENIKSTVNLISEFGLEIFLPVTVTNGVTYKSKLVGFSNGEQQTFDCVINYTSYMEIINYS